MGKSTTRAIVDCEAVDNWNFNFKCDGGGEFGTAIHGSSMKFKFGLASCEITTSDDTTYKVVKPWFFSTGWVIQKIGKKGGGVVELGIAKLYGKEWCGMCSNMYTIGWDGDETCYLFDGNTDVLRKEGTKKDNGIICEYNELGFNIYDVQIEMKESVKDPILILFVFWIASINFRRRKHDRTPNIGAVGMS